MKKQLSLFLSIVMIMSLLLTNVAFAEEATQTTPPEETVTITVQEESEQPTAEETTQATEDTEATETSEESQVTETPSDTTVVETEQPISELEETLPADDIVPDEVGTEAPPELEEGNWEDVAELAEEADRELAGAGPVAKLQAMIMSLKGTKTWDAPHLVAVSRKINVTTKKHLRYINSHPKAKKTIVLLTDETVRLAHKYAKRDKVENIVYRNAAQTYAMLGMYKRAAAVAERAMKDGKNREADYKNLKKLYSKTGEKGLKVFVKGKRPNFDVKPQLVNGRTMVPLRAISESMGAKVNYNAKNQNVIIVNGNINVTLPLNSKNAMVNGRKINLDQPAASLNGRTMVPLRFVSENLGAKVNYDSQSEVITVE